MLNPVWAAILGPMSALSRVQTYLAPYEPPYASVVRGWLDSLATVTAVCRSETWPVEEDIVDSWQRDNVTGWLLFDDRQARAYGELWPRPKESAIEIAHLLVDPALRRRGLGRELLRRLSARAEEDPSVDRVLINIYTDNEAALGLAMASGFELMGTNKYVEGLQLVKLL